MPLSQITGPFITGAAQLPARNLEARIFPDMSVLQQICKCPRTWFYDDRLAALADSWKKRLRIFAIEEARGIPTLRRFGRPEDAFTRLHQLVDILRHWMLHQHDVHCQLVQDMSPHELARTQNDLGMHISLVRYTIAALAISDFGPWLEFVEILGREPFHMSTDFRLTYLPTGYTLEWNGLYDWPCLGEPKINVNLLFLHVQPPYAVQQAHGIEHHEHVAGYGTYDSNSHSGDHDAHNDDRNSSEDSVEPAEPVQSHDRPGSFTPASTVTLGRNAEEEHDAEEEPESGLRDTPGYVSGDETSSELAEYLDDYSESEQALELAIHDHERRRQQQQQQQQQQQEQASADHGPEAQQPAPVGGVYIGGQFLQFLPPPLPYSPVSSPTYALGEDMGPSD